MALSINVPQIYQTKIFDNIFFLIIYKRDNAIDIKKKQKKNRKHFNRAFKFLLLANLQLERLKIILFFNFKVTRLGAELQQG